MSYQKGFTVVELMVTVAVSVLLLMISVPSFNAAILRMETSSLTDQLTSALYFSRNEAITRNARITLCASSDKKTCDTTATDSWSNGWIATWVNKNTNNTQVLKSWVVDAQSANINLLSNTEPDTVKFNAQGDIFLGSAGSATPAGIIQFTVQSTRCLDEQQRKRLSIAPYGSITVTSGACI